MRMNSIETAFLAALFVLAPAALQAQIHTLTVSVDGLACPFCAYGVEKKLKRVEGVESMDIRMNEGTVTISAREGLSIDIKQVPRAIRDSGFSMREIKALATGVVKRDGQGLFLQYGGADDVFQLRELSSALRERLLQYAENGETVEVEGIVEERPEGPWTLRPESVEGFFR